MIYNTVYYRKKRCVRWCIKIILWRAVGVFLCASYARNPLSSLTTRGTALYSEILGLLQRYQITPDITLEVGDAMAILGLVATGLGVSILPSSFRRARLSEVVWLELSEADARSELWLVWSAQRQITAPLQHMLELMSSLH